VIAPELYDRARDTISAKGFAPEIQTKIAILLTAAKNVNAMVLSSAEVQPFFTVAHQFIHSQYFREVEAVALLARVTRWAGNPLLYAEGTTVVAPLWAEGWRVVLPPGPLLDPRAAYSGLALGHALLARIRLAPVIPAKTDPLDPFAVALLRIEQDNGRMLQTQIRLLKETGGDVPLAEREALVEQKQEAVDTVFTRFLEWLAAG